MGDDVTRGYATVNGLKLYHELHGAGRPLLLLHGGFMTVDALGPLLPALAASRQVIAVELEGHGRTADLDRPLSAEQMAEDVAGLLGQLGVGRADVVGYSLGGMVGLRLASKHPALVRRLVAISAVYSNDGYYPAVVAGWPGMSAAALAGTPMERAYAETAPDPTHWPAFVEKVKDALTSFRGWPAADIAAIEAPTLLVIGDNDLVRPEHAVEMLRLLGGAPADGGMGAPPRSQLAVLPGTTHFSILYRTDLLLPVVGPFLDAPLPGVE